jgi:hypothetical protein
MLYDTTLIPAKYLYPKQRSMNPLQRPDRRLLRQIFNRARYTMRTTCSHCVLLDARVKFTQIVDCDAIIFRKPAPEPSHCRNPVILRSNAIAIVVLTVVLIMLTRPRKGAKMDASSSRPCSWDVSITKDRKEED